MDCDFAAAVLSLDTGCPTLDPLKQAGADTNKVVKMFLPVGCIFINGKKTMWGKILLMSDNLPNNSPDSS